MTPPGVTHMRLFLFLICLLLPATVQASCEGRDLKADLTPAARAELEQALEGVPYPDGNHWIATKGDTVLHLIGTLHLNDPRMDAIVERLTPTLGQADAFYFEVTRGRDGRLGTGTGPRPEPDPDHVRPHPD